MADIQVSCVTAADGWLCQVTVAERGSETRHSVSLTRTDFQRLTTGAIHHNRKTERSWVVALPYSVSVAM